MGSNSIAALVVAAGRGSRTGSAEPKQFRKIAGRAVIAHAVERLRLAGIEDIRIVIGEGQANALEAILPDHARQPVIGGETRRQSVLNGLESLADAAPRLVLIHDAARPFLRPAVVDRLIEALDEADAAAPVLPVVDTLAHGRAELGDTIDRDGLVRVQTPQAFRFDSILDAHRAWTGGEASDDAQIARAAGLRVATVLGDPALEKLTYDEDFRRAERHLAMTTRTGLGFDVHAFAEGKELWLGGLLIPHDRGLSGHSDADVVLHALTDALLGAIGAGDIGDHFPPTDPRWKGAESSRFLEHAAALIAARGGRIDHVDVTLVCEAPRVGPHRDAMRTRIAALLRLPVARVSVKATTSERLGFTGRGEGIAAQAVATVRMPEDLWPEDL